MRMRKKKHGAERINACSDLLLQNTEISAESLREIYNSDTSRPLWLEIGCGKGAFVCGLAAKHPDVNLIALERIADVAMLAMEKCKAAELANVRFLIGDVAKLWDIIGDDAIDRIYLNFSDPWPKAGHAKRRLTHRLFLEQYRRILKPDGAIFFKTDNRGLFDFSLDEFRECGFRLENLTYDLHNSEFAADNIMTEYEKNFSEKGFTINRVEAWCK
ncbi:MAG: tRNA (guanosine(46)-N7)-methyltransferase TrmB [Ruminococcaceae bacterium]|nr:tRNA (guanosine(46)-N7)-methyltransferase TrmB [Oscillospiraceae bacterium]